MNLNAPAASSVEVNQPLPKHRRIWLWVLGCCMAPMVVLGAIACSVLTLDSDAAALRKKVVAATNADWKTKVQVSVGPLALGLVRTGFFFVDNRKMADAKLALSAVKCASVGVYERKAKAARSWSQEQLLVDTDQAMHRRGWSRLVGVVDQKNTVLIYGPVGGETDDLIDICLSVVNEDELVVVSATISPAGLVELIEKYADDQWPGKMKRIRL